MKKLNLLCLLCLAILIISGCSKVDIQPDPILKSDNNSLSSKDLVFKKGKKHVVPWKAQFDVTSKFIQMGPPKTLTETHGTGKASHLGKTNAFLDQWWSMNPMYGQPPGFSYGEGTMTFTAANGDELWAIYTGTADHNLDPYPVIELMGTFNGGTGRFKNASGTFNWHGKFDQIEKKGTVSADGFIMY